jgi:hypothetical protein
VANLRNQPCPCGSGKKYKHCHLPREEQVAAQERMRKLSVTDAIGEKLRQLVLAEPATFNDQCHRAAEEVRRPFLESIGAGLTGEQAAFALEWQLEAVERRMRAILATRPAELC